MIAWVRYSLWKTPMTPRAVQAEALITMWLLGCLCGGVVVWGWLS